MARVSYLRPAGSSDGPALKTERRFGASVRAPNRRTRYIAGGALLLVVLLVGAAVLLLGSTHASLAADGEALAKVGMPFGGGTIERVSAVSGPHAKPIGVHVRADRIWPNRLIPAHQQVSIVQGTAPIPNLCRDHMTFRQKVTTQAVRDLAGINAIVLPSWRLQWRAALQNAPP